MAFLKNKTIKKVTIKKLFGYYDYEIDFFDPIGPQKDSLNIFYGDNGAGKTTILNLIFCLLTPIAGGGYKNEILEIPFKYFEIELSDKTRVIAERTGKNYTGLYSLKFLKGQKNIEVNLKISPDDNVIRFRGNPGLKKIMKNMEGLGQNILFIPDTRRIRISPEKYPFQRLNESYRQGFVRRNHYEFEDEEGLLRKEPRSNDRHYFDLRPLIKVTSEWIQRKTHEGTLIGNKSTNELYLEILDTVLEAPKAEKKVEITDLKKTLKIITKETLKYSKYGTIFKFNPRRFEALIAKTQEVGAEAEKASIFNILLESYLVSLSRKLEALNETHEAIEIYLSNLNSFLKQKKVGFNTRNGVYIVDQEGSPLSFEYLSSGERQIIFLLTSALIARESPFILLFDEPEMSLNIKWQRKLLTSLLECSGNSSSQLIIATHSLQILSNFSENVIELNYPST